VLSALLTITAARRAIAIVSSALTAAVLSARRLLTLIALLATETWIRLRTVLTLIRVSLLVAHGFSFVDVPRRRDAYRRASRRRARRGGYSFHVSRTNELSVFFFSVRFSRSTNLQTVQVRWRAACTINHQEEKMLYVLAVILLIAWLLGVVGTYTIGAFVHVLLVIAIVLFIVGLLSGRRTIV